MSEIAGDAFFWVYFYFFLGEAQPPQLYGMDTTQPYPLRSSKMSNYKISGIWNKILWSPWLRLYCLQLCMECICLHVL